MDRPRRVLVLVLALALAAAACGDSASDANLADAAASSATTASSTVPAPATVTPTTAPPPTSPPPTTSPATTLPPPQTFDATLTWDGETCSFDGPAKARPGDMLSLTRVNDSGKYAFFQVVYLTSGTTIEDATDFFEDIMGNVLDDDSPGPPLIFVLVEDADAMRPEGSQTIEVKLRQQREHVFICLLRESGNRQEDGVIYNAKESVIVTS